MSAGAETARSSGYGNDMSVPSNNEGDGITRPGRMRMNSLDAVSYKSREWNTDVSARIQG